jgi:uncharacterized protein YkwD
VESNGLAATSVGRESEETGSSDLLVEVEAFETACFEEVNRLREARRLKPYRYSDRLAELARSYSRRMAEEGFFSHIDPEGGTIDVRVSRAGIKWYGVAENLAYTNGYVNPVAVALRGWMNSETHRRNILDVEYRESAVGVWISRDGTVYFTEIFLR